MSIISHEEYGKLQDRWEDIEAKGDNPFDKWNAFLDTLGCIKSVSYEWHWHEEYGVPHLLDALYEVMNGDKLVYVVDFDDGSNMSHTLFFDRDKLEKAMNEVVPL